MFDTYHEEFNVTELQENVGHALGVSVCCRPEKVFEIVLQIRYRDGQVSQGNGEVAHERSALTLE